MKTLKRINIEESAKLFNKHGLEAVQRVYLRPPCGCLVAILAVDAVGVDRAGEEIYDMRAGHIADRVAKIVSLDPGYVAGLDDGFTCFCASSSPFEPADTPYQEGYNDGRKVAALVLPGQIS